MEIIHIILIIIAIIIFYVIFTYNNLTKLTLKVKNSFAGIDNQLKRRYDLIPNLVNTVKGYAEHEKELFENITKARNNLVDTNLETKTKASKETTKMINKLIAVAESYPELKASQNFKELQIELVGTEDKIAYARQYYNDNVMMLNHKLQTFPSNLIASLFNFKKVDYFEAKEEEKETVKVEL